jgi:hypothetical protein
VQAAAADSAPIDVTVGRRTYRIHDRIAIGAISMIYRCRFAGEKGEAEGIFKIARDARTNDLIENEAQMLRRLHLRESNARFFPFIPALEASVNLDAAGETPRRGNILRMHEEIRSPDELYSLLEVRAQYPAGLDARDMAWMWRRLLTVLGFVQDSGLIHGAVLPMHILIDPRDHKLVLIDWCSARIGPYEPQPLVLDHAYEHWYRRQMSGRDATTPALDIGFGVRCMIELMGGDPIDARCPDAVEPAIQRYFQRCLAPSKAAPVALRLLEEFDQLLEALWGPRKFRVFAMPPKRH